MAAKITGVDLINPVKIDPWLRGNARDRDAFGKWLKANPAATAEELKARTAGLKVRRLNDGAGLFLLDMMKVTQDAQGAWAVSFLKPGWRFEYTVKATGAANLKSLGTYPTMTLEAARQAARDMRKQVAEGGDPAAEAKADRKAERAKEEVEQAEAQRIANGLSRTGSVQFVYDSLRAKKIKEKRWGKKRISDADNFMARNWKAIADKPIALLSEDELSAPLAPFLSKGQVPTCQHMLHLMSMIYDHAATDIECRKAIGPDLKTTSLHNLAPILLKRLPEHKTQHHPQIEDQTRLAELVRACLGNMERHPVMMRAILCQLALFQRPINTTSMKWADLDIDTEGLWRVPMPEMKVPEIVKQDATMKPHHVPLPWQVCKLLRELRELTGHHEHVFVCRAKTGKPISPATMLAAIRTLGFNAEEICSHGMRGTAFSTIKDHTPGGEEATESVEAQLAHVYGGNMGNTYNQAKYIQKRREVLDNYANHLFADLATGEWEKARDEALAKRRAELDAKVDNVITLRKAA